MIDPGPGAAQTGIIRLLDERATQPLRSRVGTLLREARTADIAVARIRLAGMDLTEGELGGVSRCRVLLGHLDATTLADASEDDVDPSRRTAIHRLRGFAESGRLEVRSAGLGAWVPDFSVYRPAAGVPTCLVGAHYFGAPYPTVGPSFTCVVTGAHPAAIAAARFEELWARGHDVLPAIQSVLKAIEYAGRETGAAHRPGGGPADPPGAG